MPSKRRLSTRRRSRRGPMPWYLAGRRFVQRSAGSTMWSSTLTIFGMTRVVSFVVGSGAVMVTLDSSVPGGAVTPLVKDRRQKPDDPSGSGEEFLRWAVSDRHSPTI